LALTPLRADKKVVLAVVKKDGLALRHASDELRAAKDVVLYAVKQNVEALKFAKNTDVLFADKDIVAAAKKRGVALAGEED
jgi:lambda repressor-like predicted transcriptional regulator